jgi:hypothetical protein
MNIYLGNASVFFRGGRLLAQAIKVTLISPLLIKR